MTWKDVVFFGIFSSTIMLPLVTLSLMDYMHKAQLIQKGYVQEVVDDKIIWTLPSKQEKE